MSVLIRPDRYEIVPSGDVAKYFPGGFEFVMINELEDGRNLGFYIPDTTHGQPKNLLAAKFLRAFCAGSIPTSVYYGDVLLTLANAAGEEISFPPEHLDSFKKILDEARGRLTRP